MMIHQVNDVGTIHAGAGENSQNIFIYSIKPFGLKN
jgi:hypothetical protein